MKGYVYIDGRRVGSFEYELPTDDQGKVVQIPTRSNEYSSEVVIVVRDERENAQEMWLAQAKLEHSIG